MKLIITVAALFAFLAACSETAQHTDPNGETYEVLNCITVLGISAPECVR